MRLRLKLFFKVTVELIGKKMKLAILLVVCALTSVMAKVKVTMKLADTHETPVEHKTEVIDTDSKESNICTTQPCMWSIQEKEAINITNTVCHCKAGESCQKDEDNIETKTWIYRCK